MTERVTEAMLTSTTSRPLSQTGSIQRRKRTKTWPSLRLGCSVFGLRCSVLAMVFPNTEHRRPNTVAGLLFPHPLVEIAALQQLLMGATGDDLALVENEDDIRVRD